MTLAPVHANAENSGSTPAPKTTVALCNDQELLLDALTRALRFRGCTVILRTRDPEVLLAGISDVRPDVCVIDLQLPRESAMAAIKLIRGRSPRTRIVALTSVTDGSLIRAARDAGVAAVVRRTGSLAEMLAAVRGGPAGDIRSRSVQVAARPAWVDRIALGDPGWVLRFLTDREWEVMNSLAEGRSTDEIATGLGIALSTARKYVQSLLEKLDVRTRLQAVALLDGSRTMDTRPART